MRRSDSGLQLTHFQTKSGLDQSDPGRISPRWSPQRGTGVDGLTPWALGSRGEAAIVRQRFWLHASVQTGKRWQESKKQIAMFPERPRESGVTVTV